MDDINSGDVCKLDGREYIIKGMTRSGKVLLKTDDGTTKWATISEVK